MKVKANGISINYRSDVAERAPWLVFSNPLATSLAMWDEQAAALQDRFRVLRYDQRGHGETEASAGRYAFDTLLDDALALMDAHDYASAVTSVKCPTLFIVGEKDGATPATMAKLHDRLPGSHSVTLPGAGHISNMDRAGEFNSALRDFLES